MSGHLPDLEVVATANVGATLGLGQTTRHTQSSKSSIGIGRALGGEAAPVTHGFPLPQSLTRTTSIPISELPEHMGMLKTFSDPSLVVRPLLIIGVERDYLRGTICLVPSLTAVLYTSAVHMCTCVCVLSLCGREVV